MILIFVLCSWLMVPTNLILMMCQMKFWLFDDSISFFVFFLSDCRFSVCFRDISVKFWSHCRKKKISLFLHCFSSLQEHYFSVHYFFYSIELTMCLYLNSESPHPIISKDMYKNELWYLFYLSIDLFWMIVVDVEVELVEVVVVVVVFGVEDCTKIRCIMISLYLAGILIFF